MFSIPPLLIALGFLALGILVYSKNKLKKINKIFFFWCLASSIWLLSYSFAYFSGSEKVAALFFKIGYSGIIFIPIVGIQFTIELLKIKKLKPSIILNYFIGLIFLILIWFTTLLVKVPKKFFWGYYPQAGAFHPLFLLFFIGINIIGYVIVVNYLLFKTKELTSIEKNQLKYITLAYSVYNFASVDFFPNYNIEVYPFGYIPSFIFICIIAYTIIRYHLMDIRVAITRAGLFIAIYTLVLGIPFVLVFLLKVWLISIFAGNWWMAPLGLMAGLATIGPFFYIYISRKAEERLLREQRRYQDTLKQASIGMTRIRNLRKLLDMIVHIVTKTVKISYAAIYLYNESTNHYVLQVSRDHGRMALINVKPDNPLIDWLGSNRQPIIYEEIKHMMQDYKDLIYKQLEENMRLLSASVMIPTFLEDKFLGFIVLGEKISGAMYTPEDLNVFQVLSSQAALAIENAQFYEETKEMQDQIAQAEKMATVGTMADGLSHQINNRFYALSLIAGDSIDTIKMTDTAQCSPEIKEMINQINHALERIQSNVMQGGEVVKGILKYTRKGDKAFESLNMDQIIDGTLDMVQYKVKLAELDLVRNYPKDVAAVHGNLVQLQEVFFNFIDNAYDAIVERRNLLKEPGYRGKITISAVPKDHNLEITVEDNGMGVKGDDSKKIFTPFFTTKVSSRKGTGLGLYVVRKIIMDNHKGKISFESEFKVGTRFIIELPLAR